VVSNQTAIDRELIQNADLIVSNHPRWSSRQDGDVVRSITVGLGDDVINGAWVNVPCYINGNATTVRGWVKPKGFERPMWVSLSLEGMSSVDTKIDQIKWLEQNKKYHPVIDIMSSPWQASSTPVSVFGQYYGSGMKALLEAHGKRVDTDDKKPQASIMHAYCASPSNRGGIVSALNCVNPKTIANLGTCWGGTPKIPQNIIYKTEGVLMKLDLLKQYMFSLVLENIIQEDYITEKTFQALVMGSVPIYRGAPNAVLDFIPCDHCVIFWEDFINAKELTYYLHYLNWNRTAYDEYHQWRHSPLKEDIVAKLEKVSHDSMFCNWIEETVKPCKSTCMHHTCDFWVKKRGLTCDVLESKYMCDCKGCSCDMVTPSPQPLERPAFGVAEQKARDALLSRLREERVKAWKEEISPEFKEYYKTNLESQDKDC